MRYFLIALLLWLSAAFIPTHLVAEQLPYRVRIQGTDNRQVLRLFRDDSQTLRLQNKPASSLQTIRRRANSDVEKFIDIAKHLGFYNVKVSYAIVEAKPLQILFSINLGPKYILGSFQIISDEPVAQIALKDLHLEIGKPIGNQAIVDAERILVWNLKKKGYANCTVTHKDLIADVSNHSLAIKFYVEIGPLVHFGDIQINGNSSVRTRTILKRLLWQKGDLYSQKKIEETQKALEKTGLFSSLVITEGFDAIQENELPIQVDVQESKHRSIGAGIAYATSFGPGLRAEWENRNCRGRGEKLSFRTELWKKYQTAVLSLTQPQFHTKNQDIIWMLEYNKLHTLGFDSLSYNCSSLVQRRLNRETEIGFGARLEWLNSRSVDGHHIYYLIKAPLQFKWSNANCLMDPTKGQTLNVKVTPTSQVLIPNFFYTSHTTSLASYHSLPNDALTLAMKVVAGNIIGAARHTIPPPDRFYGGSENVLRGYRAYTVSPLYDKRKPIGGRSLLAASLETRFRTKTDLGWVFFYDVGNVYSTNVPKITTTQLHSVGVGLRYSTPIGPLRFDVAIPLRRRPNIDPHFQVYFSIGQSF